MRQVNIDGCREALSRFRDKRILVFGDLMLDEHIWGNASRISPEAPVMVVEVTSGEPDCRPGGAANVANNLTALGAEVLVAGVVGDDESGRILMESLRMSGVDVSGIIADSSRPTTRKTRIWASHRHQVVRVDWEDRRKVAIGIVKDLIEFINRVVPSIDGILISDYQKGLINRDTVGPIIALANASGKVTASNPKPKNVHHFSGIGVMTLNQPEAGFASSIDIEAPTDAEKAGRKIMDAVGCKGLVITRGGQGLSVFNGSGDITHIPAIQSEVYDVAGAGDTVISALMMGMVTGLDLVNAAAIADCSGGAVVRKVGVATTTPDEIGTLLGELAVS